MKSAIIGYPYVGEKNEWFTIRDKFQRNMRTSSRFKNEMINQNLQSLKKQQAMGLDILTVGDHPFLDRMLELAFMFNLIPSRFKVQHPRRSLALYFDMAYGHSAEKCTMNNLFSTSYCYVEPEFEGQELRFKDVYYKDLIEACKRELHCIPRVTIIGPMTFLSLTKGIEKKIKEDS